MDHNNVSRHQYFYAVGLTYRKADAETRGKFSLDADARTRVLQQAQQEGVGSLVVVSTCNRTEVYGFAQHPFQLIKLITDNSLNSNKYKVTIDVHDEMLNEVLLPIKIQLLYIIREVVTNTIKHAKATTISVVIYEDISGLVLTITDDGKGFNTAAKKKGIGLSSIRERVNLLKGSLDINTGNGGTEISVTVPI